MVLEIQQEGRSDVVEGVPDPEVKTIVPPIKTQGIKTKLIPWIRRVSQNRSPQRWVEPFLGSGVVAFNMRPREALLADTNPHLVGFYQAVQSGRITAGTAKRHLEHEGAELRRSEGEHYYSVRTRFNESADPLDFLFLNRACFNGMMRFNRSGGFNVPFCRKPNRFAQAYVTKICNQIQRVSNIISAGDFVFVCQSFEDTIGQANSTDLIYCDPPYIGRHVDYFNGWDESAECRLNTALRESGVDFILSTWHSNDYRRNEFLDMGWGGLQVETRPHFYHVGGREKNRNPMLEALVTNFEPLRPAENGVD